MSSFTLTPVEKGIMRCQHTGGFSHEDVRALANFFHDYHGKLLIDLQGSSGEECAHHMKQFRPMMPTSAIFGADIDPATLEIPDSYYTHEVRHFQTEDQALVWLREQ
ncbi:MAG: hypothetical protein JXA25_03855 [Anaerolineales bacterium]|nr:hypothetical protein [Anaerolineales bacterium]